MSTLVDEPDTWSLEEHLKNGAATIQAIGLRLLSSEVVDPRVCFHFAPPYANGEVWGDDAAYCSVARPLFEALPFSLDIDYVGGTSGIEAWEVVMPSIEWLHARASPLVELAERTNLEFLGWSFEPLKPRDFSFISCGPRLQVFNRYSPEGQAAIDEMTGQ